MNTRPKVFLAAIALAFAATVSSAAADMNPVLWSDVPDISIVRHGDTYYMTSTTMHFNPGIPVMTSKDLVNWKIASYCYQTIENRPKDNLENGENDYLYGTWASCIRFNPDDGYFYVSSFNNKVDATYLFRTKNIEGGDWEHFRIPGKMYDHSLWIEDGKFCFLKSMNPAVELWRLKDDFSGFEGEGKQVLANAADCVPTGKGLAEGSQLFKKDGYYYLFNICWPKPYCRMVAVHRAKSLEGPWEGRLAYACEGIAQGGLVDTPDGKWYAYLFGDRGGVGRIPYMIPIEWQDGWPVFPLSGGGFGWTGKAEGYARPALDIPGVAKDAIPGCCASDEFNTPELALQWQFNHNPDGAHWSLTERPGWFRITTSRVDKDILSARNTLTQRTFGPVCEGTTTLDYSGMKVGDVAGLAMFQQLYGFVAIEMTAAGPEVVLWQNCVDAKDSNSLRASRNVANASRRKLSARFKPGATSTVHFKVVCDFRPHALQEYTEIPKRQDTCRFYWSADGTTWEAIGEAMYMPYTIPHFTGYRFALFNYATKEAGGHADFDCFRVAGEVEGKYLMKPDGTNPIVKTRFSPDPAGFVDGETFYLFTGHDEPTARSYKMHNWQVHATKDMKNWEDLGCVLDCGKVFPWAREDMAWASQAIKKSGKWYWYVAIFRKGGESCVGVATADDVRGPWKDALGKPLVEGRGYIDPSVFIDDDGSGWLFWGNCGGEPGCWYAPLKENMVELAGEVKPVPGLYDESAFGAPLVKKRGAGVRKDGRANTNFEEAPWIYKLGDTYYLEYAAGGVPENWSYSTSKSIHGPWTYRGRIMDEAEGTGTIHGGSVFFKGEWYLLYHNATLPGGGDCRRSACIERYKRNPDGSIPRITATREGVSR